MQLFISFRAPKEIIEKVETLLQRYSKQNKAAFIQAAFSVFNNEVEKRNFTSEEFLTFVTALGATGRSNPHNTSCCIRPILLSKTREFFEKYGVSSSVYARAAIKYFINGLEGENHKYYEEAWTNFLFKNKTVPRKRAAGQKKTKVHKFYLQEHSTKTRFFMVGTSLDPEVVAKVDSFVREYKNTNKTITRCSFIRTAAVYFSEDLEEKENVEKLTCLRNNSNINRTKRFMIGTALAETTIRKIDKLVASFNGASVRISRGSFIRAATAYFIDKMENGDRAKLEEVLWDNLA